MSWEKSWLDTIADNGGMNEQEEIMDKVNEKGKTWIKEERLKALRGNYNAPELIDLKMNKISIGDCSDMASSWCAVKCNHTCPTDTCSLVHINSPEQ